MTLTEILTVPGAAAAAGLLTQAAKILGLPHRLLRGFAVVCAVVLVVVATLLQGATWEGILLSILTGTAAGLAAVAAYDTATSGIAYTVERKAR